MSDWKNKESLTAIWQLALLGTLCIVGVFANLLVMTVTARKRGRRYAYDWFLLNLALSDILLSGLALPLRLLNAARAEHSFYGGDAVCKIVMSFPLLNIMCSVTTMVAMSFDRHLSILYQHHLSANGVLVVISVTWILAIAVTAPQLYEYRVYSKHSDEYNETMIACGSEGIPENFEIVYAYIILVVAYAIPFILLIVNYACIIAFIRRRMKASSLDPTTGAVSKAKVRIVAFLITVTSVFIVCWTPYFVLFVQEEILGTDDSTQASSNSHAVKQMFIVVSTISNPILYFVFSSDFRHETLQLVPCRCKQAVSTVTPADLNLAVMPTVSGSSVFGNSTQRLEPRNPVSQDA